MKARQIFLLVILVMKMNSAFSQILFAKEIGGTTSYCFDIGPDTTYSVLNSNTQVVQFDKFGSLLPVSNVNYTSMNFTCFSMIKILDSCFVVSGFVDSLSLISRPFIARTNSHGEIQWLRYSNDITNTAGYNTIQVTDGGLISSTSIYDSLSNRNIAYFQKVDSAGNLIWAEILESQSDYLVFGLCPSESNGFLVTGQKDDQTFLAKFDSSGAVLWSRTIAVTYSFGLQISNLSDGNLMILGHFNSPGIPQFFLTKIDTSGNVIWHRSYLRSGRNYAFKFIERQSGDLIVVGGEDDYHYGFLLNTDPIGIPTFAKQYSTDLITPTTFFRDVFESNDRSLTLFGEGSFQSLYNASILFKVDSMGDGVCNTLLDTFQYISPNYVSVPDTFIITPILASLSSLSFTSALANTFVNDFCLNNTISVEAENKIAIYPNPVKDNLAISLPNNFTTSLLEVYNSIGQKVQFKEIKDLQDHELNIPISFPQGIYYGRLISGREVLSFNFVVVP